MKSLKNEFQKLLDILHLEKYDLSDYQIMKITEFLSNIQIKGYDEGYNDGIEDGHPYA
jgi:hypothetical protein